MIEVRLDENGFISFKGCLVASCIEQAHSALEGILDESPQTIVLDLADVEEIDISGLQLLVSIRKAFSGEGSVRLSAVSPAVKEALEISGFEPALKETAP